MVCLRMMAMANLRVLVVGMGGLGCPTAMALADAGVRRWRLMDDDVVELHNLHRQILYTEADLGRPKVEAASAALHARGASDVEPLSTRFLPENAAEALRDVDLVIEGCDNVPTKFLVADACYLHQVAVVHASAVAWYGTALAVGPRGGPCYRCLFEDMPLVPAPNCAEVGAMGPAVGRVAALQVDLALRALLGEAPWGTLYRSDGLRSTWRKTRVQARAECTLCGEAPQITGVARGNYVRSGGS